MKRNITDALFSKYIRLLCAGICSRCHKHFGLTQGLHCAHMISRGKKNVRWDRDNATALCTHCHFHIDRNPLEKQEFFRTLLGNKRFEALTKRANTLKKWTPEEIECLEADLKENKVVGVGSACANCGDKSGSMLYPYKGLHYCSWCLQIITNRTADG